MLSGFGSEVIGCAVPVPAGLPPSPALCAVKRTNPSSSSLFPCNCPHDTSPAGKCQGGFSGCVPREQRTLPWQSPGFSTVYPGDSHTSLRTGSEWQLLGETFLTRLVPSFHSAGGFVLSGLTKIGKGSIIRKKHLSASGAGWARGENRESGEKPGRYRHCKREDPAQGENRSLGAFPPRRPGRIVRRASQETCSNG